MASFVLKSLFARLCSISTIFNGKLCFVERLFKTKANLRLQIIFTFCGQKVRVKNVMSNVTQKGLKAHKLFHEYVNILPAQKTRGTVSVHCREEGCIGKYIPRGPRDFPRAGILHPEAREISRGRSPREISRAEAVYVHFLSISREVLILWCVFHLKLERSPSQCIGLH